MSPEKIRAARRIIGTANAKIVKFPSRVLRVAVSGAYYEDKAPAARTHIPLPITGLHTVNKYSYAAISLIGAIPGGFLAYMMVSTMFTYFKDMAGMMRVVACVTLAASALMTVMPLGIVIFTYRPKTDEDEGTATDADADDDEESAEVEPMEVDDELGSSEDEDAEPVTPTAEAESEESVVIDTEGMFDDDIYDAGDEVDELEEEVEESPKKKKRK